MAPPFNNLERWHNDAQCVRVQYRAVASVNSNGLQSDHVRCFFPFFFFSSSHLTSQPCSFRHQTSERLGYSFLQPARIALHCMNVPFSTPRPSRTRPSLLKPTLVALLLQEVSCSQMDNIDNYRVCVPRRE